MSPEPIEAAAPTFSFPRVSGDEPLHAQRVSADHEFSPRERG